VADGSFSALAGADALRFGVHATGFVVSDFVDASGPAAQSSFDSVGVATGFASVIYPGDTIATAPGIGWGTVAPTLFSTLGQPSPTLPAYPLVARSQFPAPADADASQGPIDVEAHSTQTSASGRTVAPLADTSTGTIGKAVAASTSKVDQAGTVVADASSMVESVTIAGVLRLGAVEATAHAESSVAGVMTTKSSFSADGATVAGSPVGVSDQGLVVAGSAQPLPDASPLAQALRAAGIDVEYLAPTVGHGVVQSAGLRVTVAQKLPTGNAVTLSYTLGVARAEVSGNGAPAAGQVGATGPSGGLPLTLAPGPSGQGGATTAAPVEGQVTSPGAPNTAALRPASSESPRARSVATSRVPGSTMSLLSFYLILVVGAGVALSGAVFLRVFALRLAWTS
jgi:hypothetical protein